MYHSFQYKDCNISYRKVGNGLHVLLLHGFGEDSNIFNQQIDFLKNHCCLIIPDLPGSGKSSLLTLDSKIATDSNNEFLPANFQLSIMDYADCMAALLKHEEIESCIFLGHSMGGYIALAFAEKYSHLLRAFGLIHSTAFADTAEKKQNRAKGIQLVQEYDAFAFLKNTIPSLFSGEFKEKNKIVVDDLIEKAKLFSQKAVQQYLFAMMNREDRTSVLVGSKVPVLFIIGTEDMAAPLKDVVKQTSMPIESHVHILEGIGHMSMVEAPDDLNKFLLQFIQQ